MTGYDSLAAEFAREQAARLAEAIAGLSDEDCARVLYDWTFWRRPSQTPPLSWEDVWLILAGRGFGKTRTGAETVRENVEAGCWGRIALVGPTAADVRDVMVEGESGLLATAPPWNRPVYLPSKRRLEWPNGALAFAYSAEEPDRLRGPQHDGAWGDEPAAWRYGKDTWDNLRFGLRLGNPRVILTGTPKPIVWLRDLLTLDRITVTGGSMYENAANLADAFVDAILATYEGTRHGQQEIHGLMLDDVVGALWTADTIQRGRVNDHPALDTVVVGVDPPGETAEAGIIVAGREANPVDPLRRHAYVIADRSRRGTPEEWGRAAVEAFREFDADYIAVESNQGGDMTRSTLHAVDPTVPVRKVRAKVSKARRAEPVATLYEHTPSRVHHVGNLSMLESQMTTWVPPDHPEAPAQQVSPDRMDALVWAILELIPPGEVVQGRATSPTGASIPRGRVSPLATSAPSRR